MFLHLAIFPPTSSNGGKKHRPPVIHRNPGDPIFFCTLLEALALRTQPTNFVGNARLCGGAWTGACVRTPSRETSELATATPNVEENPLVVCKAVPTGAGVVPPPISPRGPKIDPGLGWQFCLRGIFGGMVFRLGSPSRLLAIQSYPSRLIALCSCEGLPKVR